MKIVLNQGSVLFHEGDAADCMYEMSAGRIGVFAAYGTKGEKLLKAYEAGQFFGEMGLLEHTARSATAVALDDETAVETVSEESFGGFFRKHPKTVLQIMRQMSGNLRETSRAYVRTCQEIQALAAKEDLK